MQASPTFRNEIVLDEEVPGSAGIEALAAAYRDGSRDPAADLRAAFDRIVAAGERPTWITVAPLALASSTLADATARLNGGAHLPLFGIPFAVKDNIDVAGLPTTAGCPDFAYEPVCSAVVIRRLVAAGAIPVGKTNLDQFATGLNGTRSPYGAPTSVFDPERISGGSSSGSAVAVASGLVPFALGTDTAGSGRVPAGFNNIVGLKPTKGLLSTRGVVPACRSQDCVSVFAATAADALAVTRVAAGLDTEDAFSRAAPPHTLAGREMPFRFGLLAAEDRRGDDPEVARVYEAAAARLEALGGVPVTLDFAPFAGAAKLLYDGPWVAERLAGIRDFAGAHADSIDPVVRDIVLGGARWSAVDAFEGQYRLAELMRAAAAQWAGMDVMLLPTAPSHPTVAEMRADPIGCNSSLGRYTNFVNLMDLAALAVPAGLTRAGLPVGVQLIGPAFSDGMLALLGDRLHRAWPEARIAATELGLARTTAVEPEPAGDRIALAVVGAHLTGMPLNGQVTERGGRFVRKARSASGYSLYALAGTAPAKPGLLRDGGEGGIELEIWDLPVAGFGAFVAAIPAPLGIGTVLLADGSSVQGFLCEPHAVASARNVTAFGGWRAYLASRDAVAA
ncbi:allophanate hydrolase [uncultured Enterovirga sp.]|uniref:allophanate hydrolase n=1 Tax=uncultured Enterovirga sp. TaxID=2026352 RepID=UPI0035C99600